MKGKRFAWVLLLAALGFSQTPATGPEPLDKVQVLALLAGCAPSLHVARLARQRGISFEPEENDLTTLQRAGAEPALLGVLRSARQTKPTRTPSGGTAKGDQILGRLVRGAELSKQDHHREAGQEYRAAIQLDPGNSSLHSALANALCHQNQWDGALAEYQTAARLGPREEWPRLGLGKAFQGKQDLESAVSTYRSVLKLWPDDATVHVSLGDVLHQREDDDGAIGEYREAIRLLQIEASKIPRRYLKTDLIYTRITSDTSYMFWVGKDLGRAYAGLGNALSGKEDWHGALEAYRMAVELQPDDALTHANLGRAYYRSGSNDAAIAELLEAQILEWDDAGTTAMLGVALEKQGDLDGAITEYRLAVRFEPHNASRHESLAAALQKKGDLQGALEEYRKASLLNPTDPGLHAACAALQRKLNRE